LVYRWWGFGAAIGLAVAVVEGCGGTGEKAQPTVTPGGTAAQVSSEGQSASPGALGSSEPPAVSTREVSETSAAAREPVRLSAIDVNSVQGVSQDRQLVQLLALGNAALQREDYADAVEQFRKARRRAADHPAPVVGLVQARFGALGLPTEYKGAEGNPNVKELSELLTSALALDENYGPAHLERGRLLLVLGNDAEASASLLRARVLLPNNAEVHSLLAIVSLASGKVSEALLGFEQAARLEPSNPERLTNWGTALMLHGDVQHAISVFRRSVSIDPNNARSRGDLGTALLSTNDIGGALPHLQKAHELAPHKATFMSNLGYAYQRLRDEAAAALWYQQAIKADPKLGSAWINLGTLYAQQHKYTDAEVAFRRALEIDPEDPRARANLQDLRELRSGAPQSVK
jgi:Flp pilus assembly protein TadD